MSRDSWIQTYTGRAFDVFDPRPEFIEIVDIAHSLSQQCRFTGHTKCFYSVAQHSIHVSRMVPEEFLLWALLHDASEAYLVDVPRPLKKELTNYREIEDKVMQAVAERFGLVWPMPFAVMVADNRALATEKRDLLNECRLPWSIADPPDPERIKPMRPRTAEQKFLDRFDEICEHRSSERPSFLSRLSRLIPQSSW